MHTEMVYTFNSFNETDYKIAKTDKKRQLIDKKVLACRIEYFYFW